MAEITDPAAIRHIPLARDLTHILDLVPGVISNGFYPDDTMSILGGTARDNATILDGANLTDIFTQAPAVHPHIDLMEEIEIISTGQPAFPSPAPGVPTSMSSVNRAAILSPDNWAFFSSTMVGIRICGHRQGLKNWA